MTRTTKKKDMDELNEQQTTEDTAGADTAADTEDAQTEEPEDAEQHPSEDDTAPTEEEDADTGSKANREAAKYRTQLRETEAQLNTLTEQRGNLLRSAVEAQLPEEVPAKLFWKLQEPEEFMTEDGALDAAALTEAVDAIREEYNLRRQPGPVVAAQGGSPRRAKPGPSLHDAFRPRGR